MTTETLMTADDADTNQSSADSTLLASSDAEQAVQGEPTADQVKSTEAEASEAKAPADDAQEAPKQAPEKYEFAPQDGREFDPEVLGAYEEVARELDLSQEAAQRILDKVAPVLDGQQAKHVEAVTTQWREASQTDSEFGGDKLNENLSVARKALDSFGTPELRDLLEKSGLGNHPEMIRMLYRTGKAISEDGFVAGGNSEGRKSAPKDFAGYASALYSNHPN